MNGCGSNVVGVILDIVSCQLFTVSCIWRGNSRSLSDFCRTSLGTEALLSIFGLLNK